LELSFDQKIRNRKSEIRNKKYLWLMISIAIHGAEFFAYHGFYPEEQKLGTKFIVDVEVGFRPVIAGIKQDDISHTVDYEQLYDIVCNEMKHTRKLIETVAQSIADDIKAKYPFTDSIKVILKKMHPPMAGMVDHSSVTVIV
jgi:dihydroneopterin aldolase